MEIKISEIKDIQPRRDHGNISDLKNSIKEVGLINPITINKDYRLLAGRRRFQALKELGWKEIPIRILESENELKDFRIALVENIMRKNLSDPEEASAIAEYDELKRKLEGEHIPGKHRSSLHCGEDGWTQDKTAADLGISRQAVTKAKEIDKAIKERPERIKLKTGNAILRDKKQQEKRNTVVSIPKGKFAVVIIDPPWPYGTEYDSDSRRVASPYPEMSIENISKIEIPGAKDSVLWLWTTHRFLPDSFSLMSRWDYEYKITVVWNKEKMGIGSWLRCQVEFCLLGIRGRPNWILTNQTDFVSESRREHSRKPTRIYELAEELFPGPKDKTFYLDYFSREKRNGWAQVGNEIGIF